MEFRGKHRLAGSLGRILSRGCPEADCFPDPKRPFAVSLRDRIQRLMWAGCYEPELVAAMRLALGPGMTFVDVGAHVGYFTVLGASLVASAGAVYAFEPDPACFGRLLRNTRGYTWVYPRPMAVGDQAGEATLFESPRPDETGWATILAAEPGRAQLSVKLTTLDNELGAAGLRRLDFLKVDVEGAELRVLRGAEGTIRAYRPAVFFEVNDECLARDGQTRERLFGYFAARAYTVWGFVDRKTGTPHSALAVPEEKADLQASVAQLRPGPRPVEGLMPVGSDQ